MQNGFASYFIICIYKMIIYYTPLEMSVKRDQSRKMRCLKNMSLFIHNILSSFSNTSHILKVICDIKYFLYFVLQLSHQKLFRCEFWMRWRKSSSINITNKVKPICRVLLETMIFQYYKCENARARKLHFLS
jgi:hypothetical protein